MRYLLLLAFILSGCQYSVETNALDKNKANYLCAANNGVFAVKKTNLGVWVTCNNGVNIDNRVLNKTVIPNSFFEDNQQ
jgi:hypothetical protein